MATLPSSASITGAGTTNAQQKLNLAALRDFMADLLGTDSSDKPAARDALGVSLNDTQDFRLSLTTALPVTITDVTGATTLYATPFTGKYIDLPDGAGDWNRRASAEMSIALGTLTNGIGYDVFCYDNAGTPTLELLAWASSTARATALVYQDGVLCKSGDLTRRYLGSFCTTSTTTTEDSAAKRYLFNYYHRKCRILNLSVATASWTYTTATWRQANGSTANQINWFTGVVEDAFEAHGVLVAQPDNATNTGAAIGLNSTSTPSGIYGTGKSNSSSAIPYYVHTPMLKAMPALGLNKACLLEYSEAVGTSTWFGVINAVGQQIQSGLIGEVFQ